MPYLLNEHNFSQFSKNLRPISTEKIAASDEILYKNLTHCLETLKKSNDSADVPLVDDDVLVILAHKVILACFSTYRHTHKYD